MRTSTWTRWPSAGARRWRRRVTCWPWPGGRSWATLDAVSPAAGNPHYHPSAGPAHPVGVVLLSGTLEPNVWVDVTASLETKVDALLCHASQLDGSEDMFRAVLRNRAEAEGRTAGVRYAESFRRLTLSG